jgi:hypothetical protein
VRNRVGYDGQDGFELSTEVFAVGTFRIRGDGVHALRRSCDARVDACRHGAWKQPSG